MSYCRFGSAGWRSDVYAWPDTRGDYVVHVAASRYVSKDGSECPLAPAWSARDFCAAYQLQVAWVEGCESVPIGLPHDGTVYREATLVDLRARLLWLRAEGYRVPQSAIERIDAEIEGGEGA